MAASFNSFFTETVGMLVQSIGAGASSLPRSPTKTINREKTSLPVWIQERVFY